MTSLFDRAKKGQLTSALCVLALLSFMTIAAQAQKGLVELSSDPFTNSTSQHATEVEPDKFFRLLLSRLTAPTT